MAGHSKSKNIQHRKERQDKKKAEKNTRYSQALHNMVRSKGIDSIETVSLIERARHNHIPNEVIARALEVQQSNNFETLYYAGVKHPICVIVCVHTNNRNRFNAIKSVLTRYGFEVVAVESCKYLFRVSSLVYIHAGPAYNLNNILNAFECAEDIYEDGHILIASSSMLSNMITAAMGLPEEVGTAEYMNITYVPYEIVKGNIDELLHELFENPDVQEVCSNLSYEPTTSY